MAKREQETHGEFEVRETSILSNDAQELIRRLDQELRSTYASDEMHPVDFGPFHRDGGIFVVAYCLESPVGCGALRPIDRENVEIKRMFVMAEHRGRGFSRRILNYLEDKAQRSGFSRVVLETGNQQAAAMKLYASAGFQPIEPFGEYRDSRVSVCFAKPLRT